MCRSLSKCVALENMRFLADFSNFGSILGSPGPSKKSPQNGKKSKKTLLERIGCSMVALGGFGERFGRVLGGFWVGFGWILGGFLNFWARFCIDFLELSARVRE